MNIPKRSRTLLPLWLGVVASIGAQPSYAATAQPRIAIVTEHWKSSTGACTIDLQHATVTGVPPDVKARIDANLAHLLATQSTSASLTSAQRESECAEAISEDAEFTKRVGHPYDSDEKATWTTGLARGRWLSLRLYTYEYAFGAAHPSDGYASITFDLDHGGYPVPRSGFYTSAQRAALNRKLADAAVVALRKQDPTDVPDAGELSSIHDAIEHANIDESHLLVTPAGLEVANPADNEPDRDMIIKLPYAALRGIGTPGGPLDPATRQ